jgi:LacI family transcriptional regulator
MGRAAIDALINGPGEPPRFTFSLVARGSTGVATP